MILVIYICLIAHPGRCQTIHVEMSSDTTAVQCYAVAEFAVSVTMQDYPGWYPAGWHCEEGEPT